MKKNILWRVPRENVYVPFENIPGTPTLNALPPGIYNVGEDMMGNPYFIRVESIVSDQLITVPGSDAEQILEEIRTFAARKDRYDRMGLVHKRGILLEGPPGTGKTSTVAQLAHLVVEELKGYVTTSFDPSGIAKLRAHIGPDPLILLILEDLDKFGKHNEELVDFLDGQSSVNGVVTVATTNYIHNLPPRLTNRPSRFDMVKHIGMPSPALREAYLRQRIPVDLGDKLPYIVQASEGLSLAHLKEMVILIEVFDYTPEEAAARVRGMANPSLSSSAPTGEYRAMAEYLVPAPAVTKLQKAGALG